MAVKINNMNNMDMDGVVEKYLNQKGQKNCTKESKKNLLDENIDHPVLAGNTGAPKWCYIVNRPGIKD